MQGGVSDRVWIRAEGTRLSMREVRMREGAHVGGRFGVKIRVRRVNGRVKAIARVWVTPDPVFIRLGPRLGLGTSVWGWVGSLVS